MLENDQELVRNIDAASSYDSDYLFYLVGSMTASGVTPQSAGDLRKSGKQFFQRFSEQLKKAICGKGGPYESFLKGLAAEKDLPKLIVISILTGVPEIAAMAMAKLIAVYIALIVARSGLAAYCERA